MLNLQYPIYNNDFQKWTDDLEQEALQLKRNDHAEFKRRVTGHLKAYKTFYECFGGASHRSCCQYIEVLRLFSIRNILVNGIKNTFLSLTPEFFDETLSYLEDTKQKKHFIKETKLYSLINDLMRVKDKKLQVEAFTSYVKVLKKHKLEEFSPIKRHCYHYNFQRFIIITAIMINDSETLKEFLASYKLNKQNYNRRYFNTMKFHYSGSKEAVDVLDEAMKHMCNTIAITPYVIKITCFSTIVAANLVNKIVYTIPNDILEIINISCLVGIFCCTLIEISHC